MANPRFDRLEPARQEAILAAAAEEFATRGYEAASVNRIVERAGTSKGALYYYFEDKADLLATVVQRALERVMREIRWTSLELFTAESFWDEVRELSLATMRRLDQDTWYMRMLRAFYRLREEPAAFAATAGVMDLGRQLTQAFLERGQQLGQVRTDLPLELLVEMFRAADEAGDRWMMLRWPALSEAERDGLIEARLDFARDMLDARRMGWER